MGPDASYVESEAVAEWVALHYSTQIALTIRR
jgi:hypothetical protein